MKEPVKRKWFQLPDGKIFQAGYGNLSCRLCYTSGDHYREEEFCGYDNSYCRSRIGDLNCIAFEIPEPQVDCEFKDKCKEKFKFWSEEGCAYCSRISIAGQLRYSRDRFKERK